MEQEETDREIRHRGRAWPEGRAPPPGCAVLKEDAQILMLEQGPYVSYSNCSLPYRLSGTVDQTEKLVLMDPGSLPPSTTSRPG